MGDIRIGSDEGQQREDEGIARAGRGMARVGRAQMGERKQVGRLNACERDLLGVLLLVVLLASEEQLRTQSESMDRTRETETGDNRAKTNNCVGKRL